MKRCWQPSRAPPPRPCSSSILKPVYVAMMKNYHSFLSFSTEEQAALPGIIVPQGVFEPTVPNFSPLPPVRFQIGGQFGLRLQDVFTGQLAGLRDSAGTAMLSSPGNVITLRLYWPGYSMVSRSIFLLNSMGTPSVVTRDALAKRTAAAIRELHTELMNSQPGFPSSSEWWAQNIPFDRLYLVELRNVSQGNWQPVLCYRVA